MHVIAGISALLHLPWDTYAGVVATITGVAVCIRWIRRRLSKAIAKLGRYLEERMTEVAARIADPIVDQVAQVRHAVERITRSVTEAEAECRVDREAIWHHIGGRPHPNEPRSDDK